MKSTKVLSILYEDSACRGFVLYSIKLGQSRYANRNVILMASKSLRLLCSEFETVLLYLQERPSTNRKVQTFLLLYIHLQEFT